MSSIHLDLLRVLLDLVGGLGTDLDLGTVLEHDLAGAASAGQELVARGQAHADLAREREVVADGRQLDVADDAGEVGDGGRGSGDADGKQNGQKEGFEARAQSHYVPCAKRCGSNGAAT